MLHIYFIHFFLRSRTIPLGFNFITKYHAFAEDVRKWFRLETFKATNIPHVQYWDPLRGVPSSGLPLKFDPFLPASWIWSGIVHHKSRPQNMCLTYSWPQYSQIRNAHEWKGLVMVLNSLYTQSKEKHTMVTFSGLKLSKMIAWTLTLTLGHRESQWIHGAILLTLSVGLLIYKTKDTSSSHGLPLG